MEEMKLELRSLQFKMKNDRNTGEVTGNRFLLVRKQVSEETVSSPSEMEKPVST